MVLDAIAARRRANYLTLRTPASSPTWPDDAAAVLHGRPIRGDPGRDRRLGDASCSVAREQLGRRTATGPILAIDECQRLPLASRTMKHGAVSSTDQGAGSGAGKI